MEARLSEEARHNDPYTAETTLLPKAMQLSLLLNSLLSPVDIFFEMTDLQIDINCRYDKKSAFVKLHNFFNL